MGWPPPPGYFLTYGFDGERLGLGLVTVWLGRFRG